MIKIFFDQILFFGKKETPFEQCKEMLVIWTEEDPDASIENLKSILEELNFNEALVLVNDNSEKTEAKP